MNQFDGSIVLEHQLEEWKMLNGYLNKMDLGYTQVITVIMSVFGVITALFANKEVSDSMSLMIFIVPAGFEAVFAYLSYQFRITAIIRGHLAALEKKMNEAIGDDTHLWNSALMETYMARNNSINKWMMFPILIVPVCVVAIIFPLTVDMIPTIRYGELLICGYWIVVFIGAIIVIVPFLKNETIRKATEDEEEVLKKYNRYIKEDEKRKKQKNAQKRKLKKKRIICSY